MTRYRRNIWTDGRLYRVRKMVEGRVYCHTFSNAADAREYVRLLERAAAGLEVRPARWTLTDAQRAYDDRLTERGSGAETVRYYAAKWKALRTVLGEDCVLADLTPADASRYVAARRPEKGRTAANRTIRAELALLWRSYRLLGLRPEWTVPELRIETRRRQVPAPAAVARLWTFLDGPPRTALALCLLTGMRASEALRLTADKWDRERRVLRLTHRKSGDELEVAVIPLLAALLPAKGLLVPMAEKDMRSAFRAASQAAGVAPRWSGPGLGRHCFATWAQEFCGYTTEQVADALGHTRPGLATKHYTHARAVEPLLRPMCEAIGALLERSFPGPRPVAKAAAG